MINNNENTVSINKDLLRARRSIGKEPSDTSVSTHENTAFQEKLCNLPKAGKWQRWESIPHLFPKLCLSLELM